MFRGTIGSIGNVRYGLLSLGVFAQLASVAITWPLWQFRDLNSGLPINLPIGELPAISFGWLIVISLLATFAFPRVGVAIHMLLLATACAFDQFRMQPQFIGIAILMLAAAGERGEQFCRWYLVSMWFWAGLHKLMSLDWFGHTSWSLASSAGLSPEQNYLLVAASVVIGELTLAVCAVFWTRVAAWLCPVAHVGIAVLLGFVLKTNLSVVPWNLLTAVVGCWILLRARVGLPRGRVQWAVAILLLTIPSGFYAGRVDRCFAHVLYSGNLPQGTISRAHRQPSGQPEPEAITGWGKLAVPFPRERRLLLQYFSHTAGLGDKLHLHDPRRWLGDQYFVQADDGPVMISAAEFFNPSDGTMPGFGVDQIRSIFVYQRNQVRMVRRTERGVIFAIEFRPEDFSPKLLPYLRGLPNLEQIQLAGCNIADSDLPQFQSLRRLSGLGLEDSAVTDEGLARLTALPNLSLIHHAGSRISEERLEELGFESIPVP